jgi:hypothetical protein
VSIDDRLATIRALLAKAEATAFPAEAEAFRAKSTALMARYAVDEALVWASQRDGERDVPGAIFIELRRPYVAHQAVLVNEVAQAFGCRAVRYVEPGARVERVSVVGFASDLRLVEALVTSLLVQMATALAAEQPRFDRPSASASWRRSFIAGFVDAVATRLAEDRRAATVEIIEHHDAPPTRVSAELVLRRRAERVEDEFRRRHPWVRTSRVGAGASPGGRRSGRAAGERADLQRRSVGTRRALPAP